MPSCAVVGAVLENCGLTGGGFMMELEEEPQPARNKERRRTQGESLGIAHMRNPLGPRRVRVSVL
jgi:hypothetical protein